MRSIWQSAKLPPLVVVAFPAAPPAERDRFKASLPQICSGEGKATCDEVGLLGLTPAGAAELAPVVSAYGP